MLIDYGASGLRCLLRSDGGSTDSFCLQMLKPGLQTSPGMDVLSMICPQLNPLCPQEHPMEFRSGRSCCPANAPDPVSTSQFIAKLKKSIFFISPKPWSVSGSSCQCEASFDGLGCALHRQSESHRFDMSVCVFRFRWRVG